MNVWKALLFSYSCLLLIISKAEAFSAVNKKPPQSISSPLPDNNDDMSLAASSADEGPTKTNAILRVHGPDANGIVAAFSQLLYGHGCGIVDSEQHTDHSAKLFFQRIHFDYSKMHTDKISLITGIKEVCGRFSMESELNWGEKRKKVCVMVSKYDHVLWELLLRHRAGELNCEICLIISNHPDLKNIADSFNIPFHVFKITKDTKKEMEAQELALMKEHEIDLVVLARYMQIISEEFCNAYKVINIHHSFLPAFIGGKPYHRAHDRGVKVRIYIGPYDQLLVHAMLRSYFALTLSLQVDWSNSSLCHSRPRRGTDN